MLFASYYFPGPAGCLKRLAVEQPEHELDPEYPADSFIDKFPRHDSVPDEAESGFIEFVGGHYHVISGLDGFPCGSFHVARHMLVADEAADIVPVCYDEAVKS